MRLRHLIFTFVALVCFLVTSPSTRAQTTATEPSPSPQTSPAGNEQQQEPIKVFTEEVVIPVSAYDEQNRFDLTMELRDVLLLEDGVPQETTSLRRIPASVLLLLDTSGELNPAMTTNLTRDVVIRLVSQLRAGDSVAALQFGGRAELIQGWTTDREAAIGALKSKLFSGKRGRLSEALIAAAAQLRKVPLGSRHVVLITDGKDSSADKEKLALGLKQLLAVQATVHVISYTLVGRKEIDRRHPKYLVTITTDKRKSAQDVADELTRPNDPETLDTKLKRKIYLVIQKDFPLWRLHRKYAKALKENELWLAALAEESGGLMLLPRAVEEVTMQADEVVREVDSQYVVSYKPKRPLGSAPKDEYRRIEVAPRRTGLRIHARRGYVLANLP